MDTHISDLTIDGVLERLNQLGVAGAGAAGKVAGGAVAAAGGAWMAAKLAASVVQRYRKPEDGKVTAAERAAKAEKEKQRDDIFKLFLSSGTYLDDDCEYQWRGVKTLGGGGQGMAGLWVKVDTTNKITDRMVIKEGNPGPHFDQPDMWSWPGISRKRPREEAIHAILGPGPKRAAELREYLNTQMKLSGEDRQMPWPEKPLTLPHATEEHGSSKVKDDAKTTAEENKARPVGEDTGIVALRTGIVMEESQRYRLYVEYCSNGDLHDLLKRYQESRLVVQKHRSPKFSLLHKGGLDVSLGDEKLEVKDKKYEPIPEPYLWFVLYHLMLACKRMEGVEYLIKGEVVHQDIKNHNIFLDKPDPRWFPDFPIPRMGDFGSARLTNANDPANPGGWKGDHFTFGWVPPEYRKEYGISRPRLTSAANVWQCAMAIRSLMKLDPDPKFEYQIMEIVTMTGLNGTYSDALIKTVCGCLDADPSLRGKPQQIIDYIEQNKKAFFGDASEADPARPTKRLRVLGANKTDDYMVGMIYKRPTEIDAPSSGMSDSGDFVFSDDVVAMAV